MKLSDIMSAAGLALYAEVALVIFFVVFVLVAVRVLGGRQDYRRVQMLPLDDDRNPMNPREKTDD